MYDVIYSGYIRNGAGKATNFTLERCPYGIEINVDGYRKGCIYLDVFDDILKVVLCRNNDSDEPTDILHMEAINDQEQTPTG